MQQQAKSTLTTSQSLESNQGSYDNKVITTLSPQKQILGSTENCSD